ncbi:MAG: M15 family metallopeptidase [Paludibacteraceae bacterium]|nr:M15 family metallopeptidase [Paludibacteraceae bacterium]
MRQIFTKFIVLLLLCTFATYSFPQDIQTFMKKRITGNFDPASDPAFTLIIDQGCPSAPMYIHRQVYYAYLKMSYAASRENIELPIVSATRNFKRQAKIWERKWTNFSGTPAEKTLKILEYSSMPGTSRHHWGTDIDLCSTEDYEWNTPKLQATLKWLNENAKRFGFYMPYDNNPNRTGYKYEPWHWSYYPMADYYTELFRKLITYQDIKGFSGAHLAQEFAVIELYVFGIASHE